MLIGNVQPVIMNGRGQLKEEQVEPGVLIVVVGIIAFTPMVAIH